MVNLRTKSYAKIHGGTPYNSVVCSAVRLVYDAQAQLGECPRWDEHHQLLYWVDIDGQKFHRFEPKTNTNTTVNFPEKIGCFALREGGGFIAGLHSGIVLLDDFSANTTPLSSLGVCPSRRYNDGRCDAMGRFIAGTVNMHRTQANAEIYSIAPHTGTVTRLMGGLITANGIAIALDGKTLYHSDTPNHVTYESDYHMATGTISNTRILQTFPPGKGRPDGAAIDSQGYYWVALYNGASVVRMAPNGDIVERIAIPAQHCTMVAFGGQDLTTVYVTTARNHMTPEHLIRYPHAGGIFAFDTTVAGVPEYRYKG